MLRLQWNCDFLRTLQSLVIHVRQASIDLPINQSFRNEIPP